MTGPLFLSLKVEARPSPTVLRPEPPMSGTQAVAAPSCRCLCWPHALAAPEFWLWFRSCSDLPETAFARWPLCHEAPSLWGPQNHRRCGSRVQPVPLA